MKHTSSIIVGRYKNSFSFIVVVCGVTLNLYYIHTGQAIKYAWPKRSANWVTRSDRFEYLISQNGVMLLRT